MNFECIEIRIQNYSTNSKFLNQNSKLDYGFSNK